MNPADDFTRNAVALSLRQMFEGRHFSICVIDKALDALRIVPNRAQYDALRVLHCVDYSAMDQDMREQLLQRTLSLFAEATQFNVSMIDAAFGSTAIPFDPEKRKAVGLLPWSRRA